MDESTELFDMEYDEVSLVGAGANQDAEVVLAKAKARGEKFTVDKRGRATFTSIHLQEEAMPGINLDGLNEKQLAYVESLQKDLGDAYDAIDELAPEDDAEVADSLEKSYADDGEAITMSDEERDEALEKAMKANPEVAAIMKSQAVELAKAKGEAAEAVELAKAERYRRETDEAITKARTDYGSLPQDPAEFGLVVKTLTEVLSPTEFDALDNVLKAASAQLESGQIFKAIGQDNVGPITKAEDRVTALSKQRAESAGITFEQAYDQILNENPDLYGEHLAQEVN